MTKLEQLEKERDSLRQMAADRMYMMHAYKQMLGPKGRKVAAMWEKKGVLRHHTSWVVNPHDMHGEDVAQTHLDVEEAIENSVPDEVDDEDLVSRDISDLISKPEAQS